MKIFGKLTNDEKKACLCAWVDGKTIEYFHSGHWVVVSEPMWASSVSYRIKPEPVVTIYVNYGRTYKNTIEQNTQFLWGNYLENSSTHKLTLTEIDGVVHTAVVERL